MNRHSMDGAGTSRYFDVDDLNMAGISLENGTEELPARREKLISPWHHIIPDVLIQIFSFLSDDDLSAAAQVCKRWNEVATENTVIRRAVINCDGLAPMTRILESVRRMCNLKRLRLIFPNGAIRLPANPQKVAVEKLLEEVEVCGIARWTLTTVTGDSISPLRRIVLQDIQTVVLRPVRTPPPNFLWRIYEYFPTVLTLSAPRYRYVFDVESIETLYRYLGPSTSVVINDMFFKNEGILQDHIVLLGWIFREKITEIVLSNLCISWKTLDYIFRCKNLRRLVISSTHGVWPSQISDLSSLPRLKILQLGTTEDRMKGVWYREMETVPWQKPIVKLNLLMNSELCGITLDVEFVCTDAPPHANADADTEDPDTMEQ